MDEQFSPEGIAFDSWQGRLFIVDGKGEKVYVIDPGPNGLFEGATGADNDQNPDENDGRLYEISVPGSPELITGFTISNNSPTILGQVTTLTATVSSGGELRYEWDLGDGSTSKKSEPVINHTYPQSGQFVTIVTATNSLHSVSATTTVTIQAPPVLYLPFIVKQ